jgi:hypothetical protein
MMSIRGLRVKLLVGRWGGVESGPSLWAQVFASVSLGGSSGSKYCTRETFLGRMNAATIVYNMAFSVSGALVTETKQIIKQVGLELTVSGIVQTPHEVHGDAFSGHLWILHRFNLPVLCRIAPCTPQ